MAAQIDVLFNFIDKMTAPARKAGKVVSDVVKDVRELGVQTAQSTAKTSVLSRSWEALRGKVKSASAVVKGFGSSLSSVVTTAGLGVMVAGITSATAGWVELANTQARADAQLIAGIKSTGGVSGRTLAQLKEQASQIQRTTKSLFGDEAINEAQSILLTFTGVTNEIYDRAIPAIADMSARMGTDLKSNTLMVGKALNDPLMGITALKRAGVQLSEEQQADVKRLMEAGDKQAAQMVLLTELQTQFGGSAEAAGKAGAYGMRDFMACLNDTREIFGAAITPLINEVGSMLSSYVLPLLQSIGEWLKDNPRVVKIMAAALGTLAVAVGVAAGAIAVINAALWANPIVWIIGAVVALGAAITAVVVYLDEIKSTCIGSVQSMMAGVEAFGSWLWDWIKKIGSFLWKYSPWGVLTDALFAIFPSLKKMFSDIIDWIYEHFIQPIIDGWNWVKEKLGLSKDEIDATITVKKENEQKDKENATAYSPATPMVSTPEDAGTSAPTYAMGGGDAGGAVAGGGGSAAIKNITINIGRMVGIENASTTDTASTVERTAEAIRAVLLGVVNDVNMV